MSSKSHSFLRLYKVLPYVHQWSQYLQDQWFSLLLLNYYLLDSICLSVTGYDFEPYFWLGIITMLKHAQLPHYLHIPAYWLRSEERRVGKEGRSQSAEGQ